MLKSNPKNLGKGNMANSLKRKLNKGERFVMEGVGPEANRTVELLDDTSFGCFPDTIGRSIWVRLPDGREGKMSADEIEKVVE